MDEKIFNATNPKDTKPQSPHGNASKAGEQEGTEKVGRIVSEEPEQTEGNFGQNQGLSERARAEREHASKPD